MREGAHRIGCPQLVLRLIMCGQDLGDHMCVLRRVWLGMKILPLFNLISFVSLVCGHKLEEKKICITTKTSGRANPQPFLGAE